jgi:hypothetical protein
VDRIADILIIVNPLVRDQPAITKAVKLARWFGADIELLICDTRNLRQAHTEALPCDALVVKPRDFAQDLPF